MRKGARHKQTQPFYRRNHQVTVPTVRVLDDSGKQIDVMETRKALALAQEQGLDMVEIARAANPPVVKLIDFSKFLYQQKKKRQEEKKGSKTSETKEIRLGLFIDTHDLEIKLKKAREFITDGDKVRFVVRFTGRLMGRQNFGAQLLDRVVEQMADMAKVEKARHMEGRQMIMLLSRGKIESKNAEVDNQQTNVVS